MAFSISLSEDGTYICIVASGDITLETARNFAGQAIAQGKRLNVGCYLVDVRAGKNISTTTQKYLFAYEDMSRMGFSRSDCVAVLVRQGDTSHDFIETVFQNAGYKCRIFNEEDAAVGWIRKTRAASEPDGKKGTES